MARRTLLLSLAFALSLAALPASAYEIGFVNATSRPIGVGCYDIKSADLNGDGKADLVAAVFDAKRVAVSFATPLGLTIPTYYASGHAVAVDLADYDGNGSIDILEADWDENRIHKWLNQGDGTFVLADSFAVSLHPRDVAGGDFDGNGTRDVAVATADGKIVLLSSAPGGGFSAAGTISLGGVIKGVATGDLDNDGDPDLAAVDSQNGRLHRIRNEGGWTFNLLLSKSLTTPSDVALGDLDGDSFLDAAVSLENGNVAVVQGSAADVVLPAFTFPIGNLSQSVAIADFDGADGPDLLVSNYNQSNVQVLRNLGALQFGNTISASTGAGPRSAAPGDFNGDGRVDLVSGDFLGGTTTLLRNVSPDPRFEWAPSTLDFGTGGQGVPTSQNLQLFNTGTSPLVVTPGVIDGAEFGYSGSSGPISIQAGQSAYLGIRYFRTNLGAATGTLHLASNDTAHADVEVPLTGSTVEAQTKIAYSPPVVDFGSSYETDVEFLNVTFQNTGNTPVNVSPGAIENGEFAYAGFHDPFTLQPGATRYVQIAYFRNVLGTSNGTLHVTTSDPGAPELAIPLVGTAVGAVTQVTFAPPELAFGSDYQGTTSELAVTFQNVGDEPLFLTPGTLAGSEFVRTSSGSTTRVAPGNSGYVSVKYLRSVVGDAAGTLYMNTNDPAQPSIEIPLSGTTLPALPKIAYSPSPLDFGTNFDGIWQALPITIQNVGHASLTVTPGAIDGDQFVYNGSSGPFTLAIGASRSLSIAYLRSVSGPAQGTLHLASNDPDAPAVEVALVGTAAPPPIASFSSPPPVTVSMGSSFAATVTLRNLGPSPLQVTVPASAGDYSEQTAFDVGTTQDEFVRMDPTSALWNLDFEGRIKSGADNEYYWGMDEANFIAQTSGVLGLGGREFRLGPVTVVPGINIMRKIYIPEAGGWARFIDVAENPSDSPRTATFDLFDNIGYGPTSPIWTSDGDGAFELSDDWIVVPATDRRTVGRVFRSVGAANVPVLATWFQTTAPGCYSRSKYVATLPPHGRACVVQWAVQAEDANTAREIVEALRQDPTPGLVHADAIDRATAWNLVPGANPFRPVAGNYTIAPNDSAEVAVVFGAEAAMHDADLASVLRVTTSDPAHPVLAVPLAFSIGNGLVVGIDPRGEPGAATLALSGFRPNPLRLSGQARVAFRLANSAPATLTLYDVRGRTLARQSIPSPGPGPGSVILAGTSLAPGVVWMRLEQGGKVATGKGIVLP